MPEGAKYERIAARAKEALITREKEYIRAAITHIMANKRWWEYDKYASAKYSDANLNALASATGYDKRLGGDVFHHATEWFHLRGYSLDEVRAALYLLKVEDDDNE